jgi:hypothetical protein
VWRGALLDAGFEGSWVGLSLEHKTMGLGEAYYFDWCKIAAENRAGELGLIVGWSRDGRPDVSGRDPLMA